MLFQGSNCSVFIFAYLLNWDHHQKKRILSLESKFLPVTVPLIVDPISEEQLQANYLGKLNMKSQTSFPFKWQKSKEVFP